MRKKSEQGFSIIELLIVCVVVGVIAAIAIPHLQKAIIGAEKGNAFATLRTVASTQMNFYSQNNRFGTLTEINNILSNSVGTPSGSEIIRGKFVFAMTPAAPTPAELRDGYVITATRNVAGEGFVYQYEVTERGEIRQILPAP